MECIEIALLVLFILLEYSFIFFSERIIFTIFLKNVNNIFINCIFLLIICFFLHYDDKSSFFLNLFIIKLFSTKKKYNQIYKYLIKKI